jgi:sugar/nucleoside kinase (ribokinase family)
MRPDLLCIGAVLWDVIGRADMHMGLGADRPGRITRGPGGVAFNIARAAHARGLAPALLGVVGRDAEGAELVAALEALGIASGALYRSDDLPTDVYMAIEGANGLIAAIADAHSLEEAGDKILAPLDGPFAGWSGPVALDGNLTEAALARTAADPRLAAADLRIAPASPGKAGRLRPFLGGRPAVLYVNLEEAGLLLHEAPPARWSPTGRACRPPRGPRAPSRACRRR